MILSRVPFNLSTLICYASESKKKTNEIITKITQNKMKWFECDYLDFLRSVFHLICCCLWFVRLFSHLRKWLIVSMSRERYITSLKVKTSFNVLSLARFQAIIKIATQKKTVWRHIKNMKPSYRNFSHFFITFAELYTNIHVLLANRFR